MLRGQNLLLRVMTQEEVIPYAAFLNNPRRRLKDDFVFTSPAKLMENHIQTSHLSEEQTVLAIDLGEEKHIGFISWYLANPAVGNLELDMDLYSSHHDSEEYRQEAMTLVSKYLFDNRPIERLQVLVRPDDDLARRAAAKAGFVQEGTLRQMVFVRGEWQDLELWSVLREELGHARR